MIIVLFPWFVDEVFWCFWYVVYVKAFPEIINLVRAWILVSFIIESGKTKKCFVCLKCICHANIRMIYFMCSFNSFV